MQSLNDITWVVDMLKLMVSANDLKKGMYVSELDRPWLDSPFIFQGFRITNIEEISLLKNTCDYVFVDQEKSIVSVPQPKVSISSTERVANQSNKLRLVSSPLAYQSTVESELPLAWDSYRQTVACVKNAISDIRFGNTLHSKNVKSTVSNLTDSVIRNPDALTLLCTLKEKDDFLVSHAINVCVMSLIFGRYLGFEQRKLVELGLGAMLHDIGETLIPNEVLHKRGEKSATENKLIYSHTTHGDKILKAAKDLPKSTAIIARDHHERADGSGYPNRLVNDQIDMFTRIVSIIDIYDTATSGLYNKPKVTSSSALKNIYDWRKRLFDADLVEKFIQCLGIYPIGSIVEFRSGEMGIVISFEPKTRLTPKVLFVRNQEKEPMLPPKLINLALFRDKENKEQYKISRVVDADRHDIDVQQYVIRDLNTLPVAS